VGKVVPTHSENLRGIVMEVPNQFRVTFPTWVNFEFCFISGKFGGVYLIKMH
jgi:hypothetical protein